MSVVVTALGAYLRQRGYSGRKGRWRLRDENENLVLVTVQRSRSSTATEIRFTVNVGLVNRKLWEWELEDRADERKPDVWTAHWRHRPVGDDGRERWWTLDPSTDSERVTGDVVARVEPVCVAAEQLLDAEELVNLWRSGQSPSLTERQRREYLSALTRMI